MHSLRGKTLFITGGSRGIGLAIALRAARDGANIAIAAKTTEPHPKLPGTIYSAAEEINAAGGNALPLACDIRDETQLDSAVEQAAARFGGIDICVNNASAISMTDTLATPAKRFDLMLDINTRGTFLCTQACVPHLRRSAAAGRNPHVLMLAPPLNLEPKWFAPHVAYTIAKYGMSLCVLGMAEEFRGDGIAVNALWPRSVIATAAVTMIPGATDELARMRKPEIVADAAYFVFGQDARSTTGRFLIDEEVLTEAGVTDLTRYAVQPGTPLLPDLFVEG